MRAAHRGSSYVQAMKRYAILVLLACSACAGPAGDPGSVRSDRTGANAPDAASRSIPVLPANARADYLLVDKSERLLIAYRNGDPIRVYRGLQFGDAPEGHKRFEGDERTPEGFYTIDTRNPQSRYHLSLRISYPNRADREYAERLGRSPGGDIFIHGQPNALPVGRLPGDWTDGCIALSNREIEELWRLVSDGTPIEIRP